MNILDQIKNSKGAKFISIRGYENSKGEISNQTILTGASYEKAVANDIKKLENAHYADAELDAIRVELLNRMIANANGGKDQSNQSKAQSEAYYNVCDGVRFHIESENFFIQGYGISKTVIQKGEYKESNPRPKTILQNKIKKDLNLLTSKYKQFKLTNVSEVAIGGKVLALGFGGAFTSKDQSKESKAVETASKEYNI